MKFLLFRENYPTNCRLLFVTNPPHPLALMSITQYRYLIHLGIFLEILQSLRSFRMTWKHIAATLSRPPASAMFSNPASTRLSNHTSIPFSNGVLWARMTKNPGTFLSKIYNCHGRKKKGMIKIRRNILTGKKPRCRNHPIR